MMNLGTLKRVNAKLTTIVALCLLSNAFGQSAGRQHARLSLISDRSAITPGQSEWIGLRFELDPGWHIYWINPGDSGEPPRITWHLPAGFQAGDLQFPAPERIPDHGLMDYGYQGDVMLLSKLTIPPGGSSNTTEIGADVKYLVCREVCVPGRDHLSLTLPLGTKAKTAQEASQVQTAERRLPQPLPIGVHVSAASEPNAFVITVADKKPTFGVVSDFIPMDEQIIDNSARPMLRTIPDALVLTVKKSEQLNRPINQLRGLLVAGDKAYNVVIPVASNKTNSVSHQIPKKSKE